MSASMPDRVLVDGLSEREVASAQRRIVTVLVVAQAVGGIGITVGISTASLLARDLSGSETLAGLVQTGQVLGAAVASYLLARLMSRHGRRFGQVSGLLCGALGAGLAVVAGAVGSMPLLLLGALVLGGTTAANAAARYAATDLATPTNRGRALSTVVWATTVGAVLGPNLAGPSGELALEVGLPELTGPFLVAGVAMLAASGLVGVGLRPDPLLTARALAAAEAPAQQVASVGIEGTAWSRSVAAFRSVPALGGAVLAQALAHAVMVAVMIMTPLHMEHGGSDLRIIGLVISLHVLGMYAFAPLIGMFCDRVGRAPAIATGTVVLVFALILCGTSAQGHSWQITTGLFLLGIGWSFVTLASSAAIADLTPLEIRTDVQGVSDMVMGLTAAAAGAVAGVAVAVVGFGGLAWFAGAMVVGVAGCVVLVSRHAD